MSEVARLRQRIERECEAMKFAMTGYAVVSSHEIISCKYYRITDCQEQLEHLVGTQEATRIVCEACIQFIG